MLIARLNPRASAGVVASGGMGASDTFDVRDVSGMPDLSDDDVALLKCVRRLLIDAVFDAASAIVKPVSSLYIALDTSVSVDVDGPLLHVAGEREIRETINGSVFRLSPSAFFQVTNLLPRFLSAR